MEKENKIYKKLPALSSAVSLLFHMLLFMGAVFYIRLADENTSGGGYYVDVAGVKGMPKGTLDNSPGRNQSMLPQKSVHKETIPAEHGLKDEKKTSKSAPSGNLSDSQAAGFGNMETAGFDSTGLSQFYQEQSLNVKLKYPPGWVYLDQQRRQKLDGITFWASGTTFNPPPYVHVEVVEKYYFVQEQYKYKYEFPHFTGYYNDPEEIENQLSQVIYIRTDDKEDYTIKLIMNGKDAFREFQPVFFAMVKSFQFGNSFF
ncbi:MAG: hypothetical protein ACM3RX_01045 [Methanococcaceae archaeon]